MSRNRSYRTAFILLPMLALAIGCGDDSSGAAGDAASVPGTDGEVVSPDAGPSAADGARVSLPDGRAVDLSASGVDGGGLGMDVEPTLDGGLLQDAGADAKPVPAVATVVVLPDTQYYASSYPDVFNLQTGWVVAQKTTLNIAVVLHVGDIVDNDIVKEWTVANPAMRQLDGLVPYTVVPGNHDYSNADRKSMIDNYFSPASMSWITGTMTPGQIENNYAIVDIGRRKWLILGIEFGARDAVIRWADGILKAYPKHPAIIVTHAYLYSDGTRYDINVGGTDTKSSTYQYWNPQYYGYTASAGINDGEAMYQKLVLPNSNVRMVVCGHQTGAARLTSTRPDGTTVHQMLSDYQWLDGANFGFGYLRVLQLDYEKKAIQVQTYSPYLNGYLTDDQNQFTLPLDLLNL